MPTANVPSEPLDLEAIEKRAAAATEGPWIGTARKYGGPTIPVVDVTAENGRVIIAWPGFDSCEVPKSKWGVNADFIAHARTDIPALCRRVRELEEALREIAGDEIGMGVHRACCSRGQAIARRALAQPGQEGGKG